VWKKRRRPEKKILSPLGGRKAEVCRGVELTWTEVRSGLGIGTAAGEM
jgi:hypothetical protein